MEKILNTKNDNIGRQPRQTKFEKFKDKLNDLKKNAKKLFFVGFLAASIATGTIKCNDEPPVDVETYDVVKRDARQRDVAQDNGPEDDVVVPDGVSDVSDVGDADIVQQRIPCPKNITDLLGNDLTITYYYFDSKSEPIACDQANVDNINKFIVNFDPPLNSADISKRAINIDLTVRTPYDLYPLVLQFQQVSSSEIAFVVVVSEPGCLKQPYEQLTLVSNKNSQTMSNNYKYLSIEENTGVVNWSTFVGFGSVSLKDGDAWCAIGGSNGTTGCGKQLKSDASSPDCKVLVVNLAKPTISAKNNSKLLPSTKNDLFVPEEIPFKIVITGSTNNKGEYELQELTFSKSN